MMSKDILNNYLPEGYKLTDLKVEDEQEVSYWYEQVLSDIENTAYDFRYGNNKSKYLNGVVSDIINEFTENLVSYITASYSDIVKSIIDNYEED